MIDFIDVCKQYQQEIQALAHFSLSIKRGELLVLIGPSGCGKTTAIKMINRLIEPTSGKIMINGKDLSQENPIQLRRQIGYVVQQVGLFPHMSIFENIEIVPYVLGWSQKKRRQRSTALLTMIDMNPATFGNRYPHELSGGQQQRIGVLRALAADPEIILMDEPFGAVDPITRTRLQQELKTLNNTLHKTIVLVTHDMEEAFALADRIVLMQNGMIIQCATPKDILHNPKTDFVASFISHAASQRSAI